MKNPITPANPVGVFFIIYFVVILSIIIITISCNPPNSTPTTEATEDSTEWVSEVTSTVTACYPTVREGIKIDKYRWQAVKILGIPQDTLLRLAFTLKGDSIIIHSGNVWLAVFYRDPESTEWVKPGRDRNLKHPESPNDTHRYLHGRLKEVEALVIVSDHNDIWPCIGDSCYDFRTNWLIYN